MLYKWNIGGDCKAGEPGADHIIGNYRNQHQSGCFSGSNIIAENISLRLDFVY